MHLSVEAKSLIYSLQEAILLDSSISMNLLPHTFLPEAKFALLQPAGRKFFDTTVSMNSEECAKSHHSKPTVTLTGTAEKCAIGPSLGVVDIGNSENAYLFRVALPGVRNKCKYF